MLHAAGSDLEDEGDLDGGMDLDAGEDADPEESPKKATASRSK